MEELLNIPVELRYITLSAMVRSQRDGLLSECDWTQTLDAPVDREAWAEYRQKLRDIPLQPGFPEVIDWPIKPT